MSRMKWMFVLLLVCLFVATDASAQSAALFDELEPLFADADPAAGAPALRVDVPRGADAGFHLLVAGLEAGDELLVTAEMPPVAGVDLAPVARLHAVPVERNTGLNGRTELWDGKTNPHVIRRAPFHVFEAIQPGTPAIVVEAGPTAAFRVAARASQEAAPGEHAIQVRVVVHRKGTLITLPPLSAVVAVHAVSVPPVSGETFGYVNWHNSGAIAKFHDVEPGSDAYWSLLEKYARLMVHGRQNAIRLNWGEFFARDTSAEGGERLVLDREKLRRTVDVFTGAGIHWLMGGQPATRKGGDWNTDTLVLVGTGLDLGTPEGDAALRDALRQLREEIEANGWGHRWVQHVADEPTNRLAPAYKHAAAIVREALGDVPIVEATMSEAVVGHVDWWSPQAHQFQRRRDFFAERKRAGDRVWVYTCLFPGGPWVNRLLDQERLRQVYVGWGAAAFDIDGFLHWGFNQWRVDPLVQTVVPHVSDRNEKSELPAGDTHIVYPGRDGPWSGVRFEAHRIGLEDRQLLQMLRAADPAAADAIIAELFRGFDDFEKDVARYRAARRRLLERLSA